MFPSTAHFLYSIKISFRSQENECARPNLQRVGIGYEIISMACLLREDDNSAILAYIYSLPDLVSSLDKTTHYYTLVAEFKIKPKYEGNSIP